MPTSVELTIQLEDRPGTLARCCEALAHGGVNILAFQGYEREGQSLIRFVVDSPDRAKTAFEESGIYYTESEVALTVLHNRPGELSRTAARLGEANINIRHAYCGTDPASNLPLVIFGVIDAAEAARLLDAIGKAA